VPIWRVSVQGFIPFLEEEQRCPPLSNFEILGIGGFGYFEVPQRPSFYPNERNEDRVRSIVRDGCWKDASQQDNAGRGSREGVDRARENHLEAKGQRNRGSAIIAFTTNRLERS
jgi:hypothetical protein